MRGNDGLLRGIHPEVLLVTKNFREKKVSELQVVSDYVFH